MAFRRTLAPPAEPGYDALTSAMVGIGMGFAAPAAAHPNIEDTLLFASFAAMERHDLRVLAVLTTWFGVHHSWVNADRLTKIVGAASSARVRALWAALASWQRIDHRFARLAAAYRGPRIEALPVGSAFQLRRHGEDPRFERTPLLAPANVLRDRAEDVLTPAQLAARHRAYHFRVVIGPTYRADAWAALDREPDLSPAELARRAYASFATAWQVRRDFRLVNRRSIRTS
jgi:hypothetical protein